MVVASPAYLSPLVKQLTSIEQCREWEQVEQHKMRMIELFRQEDKKNIDMIMELGKNIYSTKMATQWQYSERCLSKPSIDKRINGI